MKSLLALLAFVPLLVTARPSLDERQVCACLPDRCPFIAGPFPGLELSCDCSTKEALACMISCGGLPLGIEPCPPDDSTTTSAEVPTPPVITASITTTTLPAPPSSSSAPAPTGA
ncbi:hypothetical protein P152DRAFT_449314 [Eremomyces bilateralis CBS 781.70]|uniref:Extracellular membrane protein CFEM domain-containing protein n=1 Tax=Eremomyces bilateralis CBS 781.70 TaxID=1392243 RepID=A0A6G1G450_9PEZI|nr:uncharacterized protein P152DRAFT_449314 [Eremomyces bilateralis CBS 781.70]KAF1812599.1 hypothetical protein P152DRAFT_449314 [Eremomyces bilateralis CBS 781.70]